MWDLLNSLFICMVSVFCGIKPNMIGFIFFLLQSLGVDTDTNVFVIPVS